MGSPKTDSKARQRFKQKLESWGMPRDEIQMCVAEAARRQQAKREGRLPQDADLCVRPRYLDLRARKVLGLEGVPRLEEEWAPPDDKGYRPIRVDPLLTGPARASGLTARAVRRGKSYSQYDYDKEK